MSCAMYWCVCCSLFFDHRLLVYPVSRLFLLVMIVCSLVCVMTLLITYNTKYLLRHSTGQLQVVKGVQYVRVCARSMGNTAHGW